MNRRSFLSTAARWTAGLATAGLAMPGKPRGIPLEDVAKLAEATGAGMAINMPAMWVARYPNRIGPFRLTREQLYGTTRTVFYELEGAK